MSKKVKKAKLTRWFRSDEKPVRAGVYEVRFFGLAGRHGGTTFAHWNGRRWGYAYYTTWQAQASRHGTNGASQHKQWRGYTTRQE